MTFPTPAQFAIADYHEAAAIGRYIDHRLTLARQVEREAAERGARRLASPPGAPDKTVDLLPAPSAWSAVVTVGKWYVVVLLAAWCFWMTWGR